MNIGQIAKLLREKGLTFGEANAIATEIYAKAARNVRVTRARDWEYLLAPLKWQIKAIGSSRSRWIDDPARASVYEPYLTLLRRTRDRIQQAQALNKAGDDLTIPQYAAARKPTPIPLDGMVWSAWIPQHMKDPFIAAFDVLHATQKQAGVCKRINPFVTRVQTSASELRWMKLRAQVHAELALRRPMADRQPQLMDALNDALALIDARDLLDVAPVQWEHLLPKQRQALLRHEASTVFGTVADNLSASDADEATDDEEN